jgi:group II intron reverse transcriptase/maturase
MRVRSGTARDAAHMMQWLKVSGIVSTDFAIDLDFQSYFDTIDNDQMLKALSYNCTDKWVLLYVSRWLKTDIMKEGQSQRRIKGTPQGGVISPLLSSLFLRVVFDGWMQKYHPEKPYERYADDIIVHCKTERQAQFMLARIREPMTACGLTLHPAKTRIVNLRGKSEKRYPRKYDFLGFTLRPVMREINGRGLLMPVTFVSSASKTCIRRKFRELEMHKRRKPIKALARGLNPVIEASSATSIIFGMPVCVRYGMSATTVC